MRYFNDSWEAFVGVGILGTMAAFVGIAFELLIILCVVGGLWRFLLP